MAIPGRPDGRVENYLANLIGQETAWEPGNPESRVEEYLDYILENGTKAEQDLEEDVAALKSIGRYLSLWNGATGKPVTDPKKLPYKYKAGDYYIVSVVGATNYMPSGTQYEGTASSTLDADAKVNDYYVFDGTTWSRLAHSGGGNSLPEVSNTDNGKVLGVVNGEWAKIDVPYTHSTILFSGTAEVEELYAPK